MPTSVEPTAGFELAVIDGFVVDCLISDNHTFESEITEFPVESGSTISDNIRNKPLVVMMDCLVSNTPLELAGRFRKTGSNPADDAYALLLSIRADRRLVSISTSLQTYDNMGLQTVSFPRAAGRGDALQFSATFKQVDFKVNKREKRVSTVSALGSGQQTFSPTAITTRADIIIDTDRRQWFDGVIDAWRDDYSFDTLLNRKTGKPLNPTFGRFLLVKSRPDLIDAKTYYNERVDQHTDAKL